jgi:hypothetical protein
LRRNTANPRALALTLPIQPRRWRAESHGRDDQQGDRQHGQCDSGNATSHAGDPGLGQARAPQVVCPLRAADRWPSTTGSRSSSGASYSCSRRWRKLRRPQSTSRRCSPGRASTSRRSRPRSSTRRRVRFRVNAIHAALLTFTVGQRGELFSCDLQPIATSNFLRRERLLRVVCEHSHSNNCNHLQSCVGTLSDAGERRAE